MDTPLKIRLTGAVILVVLAVLIVPELLTGPQSSRARPASPSEAAPIRSYTIDLTGAAPPRATSDTALATPAPAAQAPSPPVAIAPAAPPAVAVPGSTTTNLVTSAPALSSGFVVQLGSFANHDLAKRLAKELQTAGFKASTTVATAGGRQLLRVRVGPVADRVAAEALLQKLIAAGHKGPIVPYP